MSPISIIETGRALAERIPQSFLSLLARVAVAGVFWRSGQTKVDGFLHISDSTFYLFREEYKVPLLPPDLAAYVATTAEHVFPVLLFVGFASRLSALALLGMTAVIQLFVYPSGWPEHILWVTALFCIIARGPGALSLDHLIWRNCVAALLARADTATSPPTLLRSTMPLKALIVISGTVIASAITALPTIPSEKPVLVENSHLLPNTHRSPVARKGDRLRIRDRHGAPDGPRLTLTIERRIGESTSVLIRVPLSQIAGR